MLKVEDQHRGMNLRCPGCGQLFRTPAPAGAAPAAPPERSAAAAAPSRKPVPKAAPAVPPPGWSARKPAAAAPPGARRPAQRGADDAPGCKTTLPAGAAPKKKFGCGAILAVVSAAALVFCLLCAGVGFWAWAGLRDAAGQFTNLQAKLATDPSKDLRAGNTGKDTPPTEPGRPPDTGKLHAGPPIEVEAPAKLQNTWRAWRIETSNGIDASSGDGMVIDGHTIQFLWGGTNKGATAEFTADVTKEPREIDVTFTSGSWIGQKQLGIYRISKEKLEVSWAGVGETKRPTQFSGRLTVLGAGKSYAIYRGSDLKEDEAVAAELKRLEGRWMVNPKGDGVVISGSDVQFLWGGTNKGAEAKLLVDPAKDPKEMELIYTVGSERYKKRIGIYQLDGDTLTMSLSSLDEDKRPTKLAGGPAGSGILFGVYRREKDQ
jgi:uncharacterized protein (TIGR03067 family)